MDLQRINQYADGDGLTSYEGDNGNQYTGLGDDFLDFSGKHLDFASEIATERIYSVTIVNATGAAKLVLLTPSYIPSIVAGVAASANGGPIVEGVMIAAGGGAGALSASGAPKAITEWNAWIDRNPMRVLAMKIASNVAAQLTGTINILRKSPFRNLENEMIVLTSFTSEYANNDKIVTVRRPFQVDNQTEVNISIPDGATTTITFYLGAVLNTAAALDKKSKRAGQAPAVQQSRALMAAK